VSSRPWFKFYHGDWLAGTAALNVVERGVYVTLIALMYDRASPLPEGPLLARQCGATHKQFASALALLIEAGKILRVENGLWNHRVEEELSKSDFLSQKAAEAVAEREAKKIQQKQRPKSKSDDRNGEVRSSSQISESESDIREESPVVPKDDFEKQAVDGWNTLAAEMKLPTVQKFDTSRRKKVRLRLEECGGIIGWNDMLLTVRKSPHLLGMTPAKDGGAPWRADFDWIVEPKNFTKVMEGNYVRHQNPKSGHSRPPSFFESILDGSE
jgi:uncharacterized protein YdaU (DUF1376 family)